MQGEGGAGEGFRGTQRWMADQNIGVFVLLRKMRVVIYENLRDMKDRKKILTLLGKGKYDLTYETDGLQTYMLCLVFYWI